MIESLTGLSYTTALFIFAVSVLVYVIIGGFRAVVLTDAVQGVIMFVGTLVLLVANNYCRRRNIKHYGPSP